MTRNAIILAAGMGSRMKSKLYKVLQPVAGKAMVDHVLTQIERAGVDNVVTVVGHGAQQVEALLNTRTQYVLQAEQLGTGHAVLQAKALLGETLGTTLIVSGDSPLFTADTFNKLYAEHEKHNNAVTVLTSIAPDPFGYGRIIRGTDGKVAKIVEEKDANTQEQAINEINTGVYVFDNQLLFSALDQVTNDNAQGEYYLPDTLAILKATGQTVGAYTMADFSESMGVNDRVALSVANAVMQQRINRQHMQNGVTLVDPQHTYIDADVVIGNDTTIEPNVNLKGHTVIGSDVVITSGSTVIDSTIEDGVTITASQVEASIMRCGSNAGPFAHLRPQSDIGEKVHIGNFVETKKVTIGKGTKVGHLTYVGDATLGADINIGAGCIFVNYDGVNKFHTTIGDHAFIGSNTKIIAPVTIGDFGITAAGSTITEDIPSQAMGIARSRQTNKLDFWQRTPQAKK
ncbi:bifunctional UDP-N-acetylglucosamine diphosphorylase/glucosamine-1-phosphate N-acetyltransferase GlmU [Periweissella beninensis]|uniref:Bifunctional protein GlmU n=1 Tax=Periweissella beninensis TaxID=504936 RepID=A0ABT0VJ97_9LACO|nr:bifunctional UDP-N-acetylglucosamine diphosphorylase/glucosamine-1-phosphate N-acetyltransferase GlmU [Periweissella beninensis]MBM7543331.1 bifunctional UDP-N-acetylglucosamine pyrophosphorylase/glucosamine-1-phosphate N-acetyltransferase [Periweissella beninensis]MCM2437907.1 bifunctional UDP-N-acetylglucosamine diphosphorylase/glucosamine-1-phosphate N-acetyltransferase GlmU [Periweissella beninensis]MCT4396005.1 bifunctional UDP-N-acetylglucosamine diphosphorylase/glucosamine-1-phosphate 